MSLRSRFQSILQSLGRGPVKHRGQNFLVDEKILEKIATASHVKKGELVLEIGPGLGALTERLLKHGARVTGIEIDPQLADYLRREFPKLKVETAEAINFLKSHWRPNEPYHLIANIPYNISGELLGLIPHLPVPPETFVLLVQREVAERAIGKEPNALAIFLNLHGQAKIAAMVPKGAFFPPPKVNSAVLVWRKGQAPKNHEKIEALVRKCFADPRKKILNTSGFSLEDIISAGLTGNERPADLSLLDWVKLQDQR